MFVAALKRDPFTHGGSRLAHQLCARSPTVCSLTGPRVLLNGSEDSDGDGVGGRHMECTDPIDCLQKCRYLERTSRHGFGAPPACALCTLAQLRTLCRLQELNPLFVFVPGNQYCSSNLITTVMELKDAFKEDLWTIGRLIAACFMNHGLGGCICQFAVRRELSPPSPPSFVPLFLRCALTCQWFDGLMV